LNQLKFESNPGKQTALAIACIVIGGILAWGFRDFDGSGLTNSLAGFLLGLLLLGIGAAAFSARGKQTIEIDPRLRRIVVVDETTLHTRKRVIPFADIVGTHIGYLGRTSNHVRFYSIILELANGETFPLFAPGRFYEGGSDRGTIESRRQHLDALLQQTRA